MRSSSSLLLACATLTVPTYPMMDVHGHEAIYRPPLHLCRLKQIPCHLLRQGSGFNALEKIQVPGDTLQIFLDMSELSQCLQSYMEGSCHNVPEDLLYDCCQMVQHRILSLPQLHPISLTVGVSKEQQIGASIYEALRVAMTLYSLHVIFPVPKSATVREQLLPRLQAAVHECDSPMLPCELQEILLWCSFVGAVAQTAQPRGKAWLASQSLKLIYLQEIKTYQDLKMVLKSMAWVDLACDDAGLRVWNSLFGDRLVI